MAVKKNIWSWKPSQILNAWLLKPQNCTNQGPNCPEPYKYTLLFLAMSDKGCRGKDFLLTVPNSSYKETFPNESRCEGFQTQRYWAGSFLWQFSMFTQLRNARVLQRQDTWASTHLNANTSVFHLQLQGLADECQTRHSMAGEQRERL